MDIDIDWNRISVLSCEINDLEDQNLSEETIDNITNYATRQILRELGKEENNEQVEAHNENARESVKWLLIDGLQTDGGSHKQWTLWEIAKKLGLIDVIKEECKNRDYDPEEGIAP